MIRDGRRGRAASDVRDPLGPRLRHLSERVKIPQAVVAELAMR